ncbi:MAG: hypothetical protein WC812_00010 [Candidatus Pacearchaeota archaeon]|jgi:hypothetical protein
MKKEASLTFVFLFALIIISLPLISAGFPEFWNKVTGKVTTSPVDLNITVTSGSAPLIYSVQNSTMTDVSSGLNEGPNPTYITINFSVSDTDGNANINDSSARINFTKTGETTRENLTCTESGSSGNYANYTCNVTMWWWDGAGLWNITAYISDINSNSGINDSQKFSVGTTAGFQVTPSSLTFSSISPGATNQQATNDPMSLNNTGNLVRNVQINATNLYGEQNNVYALGASNFSVNTADACAGTAMVSQTYTSISGASLPIGNYTINDGTAQEQLYFCLDSSNSNLISQSYSTSEAGAWTIKIIA